MLIYIVNNLFSEIHNSIYDSQLKIIQKNTFFNSKIERIFIPNNVII